MKALFIILFCALGRGRLSNDLIILGNIYLLFSNVDTALLIPTVFAPPAPSLIITEIADPKDKYLTGARGARYIELYSVDGAGQTIDNSTLYLLRWTNNNAAPTYSGAVPLNGLTIRSDGFLVICNQRGANYTDSGWPINSCDLTSTASGSPADSNGDENMAIVLCGTGSGCVSGNTIIDIYGKVGEQGNATNGHYFQCGSTERLSSCLSPKST